MNSVMIIVLVALAVVVILQVALFFRKITLDLSPLQQSLQSVKESHERMERSVREEIARNREELTKTLKGVGDTLFQQLNALSQTTDQKLEKIRLTLEQRLQGIQEENTKKLDQMRQEFLSSTQKSREEVNTTLKSFNDSMIKGMTGMAETQQNQMKQFSEQIAALTESNQARLDGLKTAVEEKLRAIQEDNAKQLEQMRVTVDEKLQGTLEKRLGESFKQVSERLEQVYKGLGEMQTLASGVGDLKKMLTNVKTRGTWGEVQLGSMLEQVFTSEQYSTNVATKNGGERVEFAIKLPGQSEDPNEVVWLPIDAKFPMEDYQRLVEAQEKADIDAADAATKQLDTRIKLCARDICEKYLSPPNTTDFGILFLPTEGLFAEVVRRPGLYETVQRDFKVMIAGPTTLMALLNSLQMGFRTLAIQKRSSEVWNLLSAVKTEWSKYGDVLDKVQKKLNEASDTIEKAQTRTRVIGRKLKEVQQLPSAEAQSLLMVEAGAEDIDETEEK